MQEECEIAVIGAGLVGLAAARALLIRGVRELVVLDAEDRIASHQSGHNSGVLHAGLYYRPGSHKARLCADGRRRLEEYCRTSRVPFRRCGKVVVATSESQAPALEELARRGRENGVEDIEPLDRAGIRRHEPHAEGIAGLWVPATGVVDFGRVARALADEIEQAGSRLVLRSPLRGAGRTGGTLVLRAGSHALRCRKVLNCAGLQADRVARLLGVRPPCRIVPFRGSYRRLRAERSHLVRGLIYPVPDPAFPFLGVHLSRHVDDTVTVGPDAVLALHRHGYRRRFSPRDVAAMLSYPGFWRMAGRHARTGLAQMRQSWSRRAFADAAARLVPELRSEDLLPGPTGVRAQAVDPDGTLADDFRLACGPDSVHVLSAPSPAATACLSIGEHLAEQLLQLDPR